MSAVGLVDPRLLRSVRVEHDWYSGDPVQDYVLGSAATDTIREVLKAAENGPRPRAFTVTGPYGTGKSALALFLADLLGGTPKRRKRAEKRYTDSVGARPSSKKFLPVLATCRGTHLDEIIRDAGLAAAQRAGLPEPEGLVDFVKLAKATGFDGVLLVLDELGKALEFAAREPSSTDLFLLQEIAELAARSETPLIVVGVLHQSFAGYADGLDVASRNEWTKIQGRFRDLPFLPSEATLAHLVADSIGASPSNANEIGAIAHEVRSLPGTWPAAMEGRAFADLCRKSWPLHPMTVAALPILMRRFGQNERSLFAFLVERGLLIDREKPSESVRLADLFEHVSDWIGHGGRSRADARRWRLAVELLHARPGLDADEQDVLRTVALLTALGRFAPFTATTEAVSLALPGASAKSALERLRERSALVHRRHLGAWVLWEGSDVDLDGLLDRARTEVSGRINLGKILTDAGALRPPLAQRHYQETGTLRWFRPMVVTDPEAVPLPGVADDPTNGILAVALGATPSLQARFETWAKLQDRTDLIVAVVHRAPSFRNLAEELEAVIHVEREAAELRGDRVAREELAARKAGLSAALAVEAERLLEPSGEGGCAFFRNGKAIPLKGRRGLARMMSDACDERFAQAPRLRNELINRRSLSSAAAAARRDLLEAMLSKAEEPKLGFGDGYPPERSIYESLLLESGLHRDLGDGRWGFAAPQEDDPAGLRPLWDYLETRLFGQFPEPIRVDELAKELRQPPFGLVDGPFPILLAAFLLAYPADIAMYREGGFVPEPGIAQWELLPRRYDLFAVAGCRQIGSRRRALELVCDRLGVSPPALMPAVRFVIKAINGLAPRARVTKEVSAEASAVRAAALEARSPERFFFHDLPEAMGLPPLGESEDEQAADAFFEGLRTVLRELDAVVDETRRWARAKLAAAAGFPEDEAGFAALRVAAREQRDRMDDPKARDLCSRLMVPDAEAAEIGALSLVAMRPVETWTDADRDNFAARALAITRELRGEASRMGVLGDRSAAEEADQVADELYRSLDVRRKEDPQTLLAALKRLVKRIEGESGQ